MQPLTIAYTFSIQRANRRKLKTYAAKGSALFRNGSGTGGKPLGRETPDSLICSEGFYRGLVADRWRGRWEGGTHTGPAFKDFLIGSLPAATGKTMRFTGTTVLRIENGKITEEIGLNDGVTALMQLGLLSARPR
jgi:hypothetical protein